jgi:hypothetical protein
MSINTRIISDDVPIDENGFHWRAKNSSGTIYYIENGRLLTIDAEVPDNHSECDILVQGKAEHLKQWEFPDKEPIGEAKAREISQKLVKWLKAHHWKHKLAESPKTNR